MLQYHECRNEEEIGEVKHGQQEGSIWRGLRLLKCGYEAG